MAKVQIYENAVCSFIKNISWIAHLLLIHKSVCLSVYRSSLSIVHAISENVVIVLYTSSYFLSWHGCFVCVCVCVSVCIPFDGTGEIVCILFIILFDSLSSFWCVPV